MLVKGIRFPGTSSIGIKPVSIEGTERIIRASMDYAIANERKSLTIVHKGNIMKFTEGKFKDWAMSWLSVNMVHKIMTVALGKLLIIMVWRS